MVNHIFGQLNHPRHQEKVYILFSIIYLIGFDLNASNAMLILLLHFNLFYFDFFLQKNSGRNMEKKISVNENAPAIEDQN